MHKELESAIGMSEIEFEDFIINLNEKSDYLFVFATQINPLVTRFFLINAADKHCLEKFVFDKCTF